FAACTTAASPSPTTPGATSAPTGTPAGGSPPPFENPMVYPETAEAPCGTDGYSGIFKKISALDRLTVEFQLCVPDVAFLSKIAFSAFAIDDTAYLEANAANQAYLEKPNGTGPYRLVDWDKGNRMVMSAFDGYWGEKALTPNLEFRWS